jgi:hypothetical protein
MAKMVPTNVPQATARPLMQIHYLVVSFMVGASVVMWAAMLTDFLKWKFV